MKPFKLITIALLILITTSLIINSCKKENCVEYSSSPVFKAEGPKLGKALDMLTYTISFSVGNSCGKFEKFEDHALDFTREIKVITKYSGCACLTSISQEQMNYTFQPLKKGTYYLKFYQKEGEYLIDTVVVD